MPSFDKLPETFVVMAVCPASQSVMMTHLCDDNKGKAQCLDPKCLLMLRLFCVKTDCNHSAANQRISREQFKSTFFEGFVSFAFLVLLSFCFHSYLQ